MKNKTGSLKEVNRLRTKKLYLNYSHINIKLTDELKNYDEVPMKLKLNSYIKNNLIKLFNDYDSNLKYIIRLELDKNCELIISHIHCYLEFYGQLDIHHSNKKFKIKREDDGNLIDGFNHDYILN
jgi:hypothetical protein